MRKIKPIEDCTDKELEALRNNYHNKGKTEGGPYTLPEVNRELLNRRASDMDGKTISEAIVKLATQNENGFTSYGELFKEIHKKDFLGNNSQRIISADLDRAIHYCISENWPIVTTLVINQSENDLTPKAIENIYDSCRELGLENMPLSKEEFIRSEQERSRQLLN